MSKTEDKPEQEDKPRPELQDMVESLAFDMEKFKKENIPLVPPIHDFEDKPKEVKKVEFRVPGFEPNITGSNFVAVRPVDDQKTYLGIYLGNAPAIYIGNYNIPHKGILFGARTNPMIFIPDLMKVVFGYESWWGQIKDKDQLRQITDDDIKNVWYVKALNEMTTEE